MSARDSGNAQIFLRRSDGQYDLNQWNNEYWTRFENLLRWSRDRNIIIQIELWDRFDYASTNWDTNPWNPKNNINYTTSSSGMATSYSSSFYYNNHPFFDTVPVLGNNTTIRQYQEKYIDKLLSISLNYPNVLYTMDNETAASPEWAKYWSQRIKAAANARGKTVYITEMWDDWNITTAIHKQTFDHPELYNYADISQNNHIYDQTHWDRLQSVRGYLASRPWPLNSVKIYGAGSYSSGNDDMGLERFWRNIIGGTASSRFHRPTAGLGLSNKAKGAITAARKLETMMKMWELTPNNNLLSNRASDEAYLAAQPGEKYALYFTNGGSVGLNLTGHPGSYLLRWINIQTGNWGSEQTLTGGSTVTINAPSSGHWVAGIVKTGLTSSTPTPTTPTTTTSPIPTPTPTTPTTTTSPIPTPTPTQPLPSSPEPTPVSPTGPVTTTGADNALTVAVLRNGTVYLNSQGAVASSANVSDLAFFASFTNVLNPLAITAQSTKTSTGYTVEIKAPWSSLGSVSSTATSASPSASTKFSIGDSVTTTGNLSVRERPNGTTMAINPIGTLGRVIGNAVFEGGIIWWQVQYDTGHTGWSMENYLEESASSSVVSSVSTGQIIGILGITSTNITTQNKNTLEHYVLEVKIPSSSISTATSIQFLTKDSISPTPISGANVNINNLLNNATQPTTPTGSSASIKFSIGDSVATTGNLSVRERPNGTTMAINPIGTLGRVIGSAVFEGGIIWWQVQYDTGNTGWSMENYLKKSSSPSAVSTPVAATPSVPTSFTQSITSMSTSERQALIVKITAQIKVLEAQIKQLKQQQQQQSSSSSQPSQPQQQSFTVGDRISTTASLHIRNRASVNGSKVTTVSRGSLGTIIAGPTVADGHNWWHVSYDNGSNGWSVEDYLIPASSTPTCTFNGQIVQHGASVMAYQSSAVAFGESCANEQRTCSNGTLSGSYTHSSCAISSQTVPDSNPVLDLMRHPELLRNIHRFALAGRHFYTAYPSIEPNQASGWRQEGVVKFALLNVQKNGTIPLYRLQKGIHLYTVSETERADAIKNGFVDEGIVGYLFPNPAPGLNPLYSWYNKNTSVRFLSLYQSEGPAITAAGYAYEGPIGYVFTSQTPRRIGVYYFGMFSPALSYSSGRVTDNIKKYYGGGILPDQFWFSGVRDFYTRNLTPEIQAADPAAAQYFAQDWSFLKPAIGWYDQRDPTVLERHINQARSNGISYFNFYWYWDMSKGELGNDGLDSYLLARNRHDIDFAISICEHGWNLVIPRKDFQKVSDLITQKYLSQPNYLHTRDGKLIVEMCDPTGIRTDAPLAGAGQKYTTIDIPAVQNFIETLRLTAKQKLRKDLKIAVRLDANPDQVGTKTTGVFDAGTCIAPILNRTDVVLNAQASNAWMTTQAANWPSFWPCLAQRIDERPRVGIMKSSKDIFYYPSYPTANQFRAQLQTVKNWMDGRPQDELSQFLTLYAWNEWHEGGILEPNVRDGAHFINNISDVFNVPYTPLSCRVSGLCPDATGR